MTLTSNNKPLACKLHSMAAPNKASDTSNATNRDRYVGGGINSHCIMSNVAKKKQTNNILSSLVLYTLIHLTANIILTSHNHAHHQLTKSNIKAVHPCPANYRRNNINQNDLHCPIEHLNQIYQLNGNKCRAFHGSSEKQLQSLPLSCSSKTEISSTSPLQSQATSQSPLTSLVPTQSPTTYFSSLNSFVVHLCQSLHGPHILKAQAAPNGLYQPDQDKDIIVLNSTNFNTHLIQYNHPFPHIKLIEYYLPYCGICLKFKTTYTQLAREIRTWRNVIRPSAIDLGVSSNSPIAHSWSIDVVPTLRIHPPLNPLLASKLDKQLSTWISMKSSSPNDLQRAMYEEYSGANPFISSLDVFKYTIDPGHKRDSLSEKVPLLKYDLVRYIEHFVQRYPKDIPTTWPNLKPVMESSLAELRKHHPREELFLIIEAGSVSSAKDKSLESDIQAPSLGLRVMLELSSSPAWKAIRYVRASENRALIEDVIAEKRREEVESSGGDESQGKKNGDTINGASKSEQVNLLASLLEPKAVNTDDINNLMLIHVDNSFGHQPLAPKSHLVTIVTGSDLVTVERSAHLQQQQNQFASRSRRSDSLSVDQIDSLQRKIELMVLYVNQTYTETKEDRTFVEALKSLDEDPTSFGSKHEAIEKFQSTTKVSIAATTKASSAISYETNQISTSASDVEYDQWADEKVNHNPARDGKLTGLIKSLNPFNSSRSSLFLSSGSDNICQAANYDNKLKSLRYMLFAEVPRVSLIDKSLVEKQEKLNTLTNLVAVIKSYFPLPDSASIQFIDTIQAYLNRQQSLYSSVNFQEVRASSLPAYQGGFDTMAFKQELKRIESDGKQLPEIRRWKSHCALGEGQLPDIWSIFFTMTAFEYKKLNQIYQQRSLSAQAPILNSSLSHENQSGLSSPVSRVESSAQQQHDTTRPATSSASPISPIERLVSPPSTTTSLSLTIATPIAPKNQPDGGLNMGQASGNAEAELPIPVVLVLRDYLTNFHDKTGRAKRFLSEMGDLNLEGIRQQPVEFSLLWLWETYNRISKRLSVDAELHPMVRPKDWFPTYEQCKECYKRPPSFLGDPSIEPSAIFLESIEWDKWEILNFLLREFTWQPMDNNNGTNIFGYQVPYGFGCLIVIGVCSLLLIVFLRCASCYIDRQRRHKASLLNGNGVHYSVELQ